jgi:hypothetical protein
VTDWTLRRPPGALRPSPGRPPPPRPDVGRVWVGVAPLVALFAVGVGLALGWRGVDMAAAVHRVSQFRQAGYSVWDASWYGGQWTLDYSVVFAPVASTLGLRLLSLLAAGGAALGFERVVTRHFGPPARFAAVVFALSTVVETSIGQLPFLSGEALALVALWAATRRRWPAAWAAAIATSLLSPLAGAFLALGAVSWLLASHRSRDRRWSLAVLAVPVAVGLPVVTTAVLFPGQGVMPFSAVDCLWDLIIAAAIFVFTPSRQRALRVGTVLYGAALVASYAVASPVGNNIGRLEDCLALPLAVLLLWPYRRVLLAVAAVPLVLSQWGPALGAMTSLASQPQSQRGFYVPLDRWLTRSDPGGTLGRVEVVPTQAHWESVWVAAVEPLARGWERQTDVAANPIFYRAGALTPASYRAWLLDNGVAFVALPDAPLDFAAQAEGRLITRGVPGLRPVWHDRNWQVWAVAGSTGLVAGPAHVVSVGPQRIVIAAPQTGPLTLRVAWHGNWTVRQGDACAEGDGRWTRLDVARPGTIVVSTTLRSTAGQCR